MEHQFPSDMLTEAQANEDSEGILYLCQDMRAFELYGTAGAIVSLCDSINYLSSTDELLHAPFGTGNSKPLFALKDVGLNRLSYMGKAGQYLRLNLQTENGGNMTGLMFRGVEEFENNIIEKYDEETWQNLFSGKADGTVIDIIYEPSINEYRGTRSLQVIIENFK